MAAITNTVTVKLRLDLGELITQLRNLADTLEATQTPKLQDDGSTAEPDKPTDCERCGTSYDDCTKDLLHGPKYAACCGSCFNRATHNQGIWEAWNRNQPKADPQGLPPEYDGQTFAPEDIKCTHEAWDVHPNGITRHCSDCRATLHDLEPGTCPHCGATPTECTTGAPCCLACKDRIDADPLFGHPERVTVKEFFGDFAGNRLARKVPGGPGDFPCCAPEPANFTDGTKPARNPHTLDLPEGMDPAEAEHILRVADDAVNARTQPIMFFRGGTLSSHGLVARITPNQPAPDLGVDSDGLRCPQCDHPWHPRTICPTCGCDQR